MGFLGRLPIDGLTTWFELCFRFSIYALTSSWIDDKIEESTIKIDLNVSTGKAITETITTKEMKVPRKYRNAANKL